MEKTFSCPSLSESSDYITIGHGGGGRLMHDLIDQHIRTLYQNPSTVLHDSALIPSCHQTLAFTTDSYVVKPIFFPGGDIGKLAVCGTVNDLCMASASPKYISVSFIIEEGFLISSLDKIIASMVSTAKDCGVSILTGDTKVVERGKGDEIFINTTGIGFLPPNYLPPTPTRIDPDDVILVSGDLGRHGVAIMSARVGETGNIGINSDCAPLHNIVDKLIEEGVEIHCMRDLTRGGLASALNELSHASRLGALIFESLIPVDKKVAAYCEILGLEPLYLANEGRFICVLKEAQAEKALSIIQSFEEGKQAAIIGRFNISSQPEVRVRSEWESERFLMMLSGDPLPRIC